jgi:DNA-binding XRE family transcriptional regulator
MALVVDNNVEFASQQFRKQLELRLSKLPSEAIHDLLQLFAMAEQEEDEDTRGGIAATIREIIWPESLKVEISQDSLAQERVARARVDEYRRRVGMQIKKRRNELRLTQEELAERTGLPQSHICRLEVGQHAPTFTTMEKLAEGLETTPDKLDPGFNNDDEDEGMGPLSKN